MIVQVEFIIMGGTFMSMPEDYRAKFIAQLHNALSGYTGLDVDEAVRRVAIVFCVTVYLSNLSRYSVGSQSRANQKRLVLLSKLDQITVYDRI